MEKVTGDLGINDLLTAGARAPEGGQAPLAGRGLPGQQRHGPGCLAIGGPSSSEEAGDTGTDMSPGSFPCRRANPTALSPTACFRLASSGNGRDRTPLPQPRGAVRTPTGTGGKAEGPGTATSAQQGARTHTRDRWKRHRPRG